MTSHRLAVLLLLGACGAETAPPAGAGSDMVDAGSMAADVGLDSVVADAGDPGVDIDEPEDAEDPGADIDEPEDVGDPGADIDEPEDAEMEAETSVEEDTKTLAEVALETFQTHCASCHGAEGQGTPLGYELRHPPAGYFEWVVRNGRPGVEFPDSAMPAWNEDTISDEVLAEMAAWLGAFPQPTTGEGLYKDYCANCHGQQAEGGPVFHDLHHEADHHDKIFAKVRNGVGGDNYADRLHYMPSWTTEQLSDPEITLIIEHLNTL